MRKATASPDDQPEGKKIKAVDVDVGGDEICFTEVENTWTQGRESRPGQKIDTTTPLRGGQWVLNDKGAATTLSFCFEKDGCRYGLTCGYLVNETGQKVFGFTDKVRRGKHCVRLIGEVVEISQRTDSAIFRIEKARPCRRAAHPSRPHSTPCVRDRQNVPSTKLLLAERAGLRNTPVTLPNPTSCAPSRASPSTDTTVDGLTPTSCAPSRASPSTDTTVDDLTPTNDSVGLISYAAQRRGARGSVTTSSLECRLSDNDLLEYDVGISLGDGTRPLTDAGDCGGIFIDKHGTAISMHHVLREFWEGGEVTKNESFGVPMQRIVDAHPLLGGTGPVPNAQGGSYLTHKQAAASSAPHWKMSRDIAQFDITIVNEEQGTTDTYQIAHIPFSFEPAT